MKRKTCVNFVSLKTSSLLIRRTRVPNLGRWLIYPESTKTNYRFKEITNTKRTKQCLYLTWLTNKIVSIPTLSLSAQMKYFAHRIHSSPLGSSEKLPVESTKSASWSPSSVVLSPKGTVRSESESDEVSDGVGFQQTISSVFLKDQEEHSTQAD